MATHSSILAWRIPGTEETVGYSLWATVHRVAESQIELKQLSTQQRSLLSVLLLGLGKLSQWVLKIGAWLSIHLFMY